MDAAGYLDGMRRRLADGGYDLVDPAAWPGVALIGHRSEFRLRWVATRLHLFVTAAHVAQATAADLEGFTRDSVAFAKDRKGGLRGLQTGVAALAVLVADSSAPSASQYASATRITQFAAFGWPVLVDVSAGFVSTYQESPFVGSLYTGWLREQVRSVAPPPR